MHSPHSHTSGHLQPPGTSSLPAPPASRHLQPPGTSSLPAPPASRHPQPPGTRVPPHPAPGTPPPDTSTARFITKYPAQWVNVTGSCVLCGGFPPQSTHDHGNPGATPRHVLIPCQICRDISGSTGRERDRGCDLCAERGSGVRSEDGWRVFCGRGRECQRGVEVCAADGREPRSVTARARSQPCSMLAVQGSRGSAGRRAPEVWPIPTRLVHGPSVGGLDPQIPLPSG